MLNVDKLICYPLKIVDVRMQKVSQNFTLNTQFFSEEIFEKSGYIEMTNSFLTTAVDINS